MLIVLKYPYSFSSVIFLALEKIQELFKEDVYLNFRYFFPLSPSTKYSSAQHKILLH